MLGLDFSQNVSSLNASALTGTFGLSKVIFLTSFAYLLTVVSGASYASGSTASSEFLGLKIYNFQPAYALTGGLLLGIAAAVRMYLRGDVLGVSGIVGGIVKGKSSELSRWAFLLGLLVGGVILKSVYPSALGSMQVSELRLIIAGLAVGIGSTMGNGCTSGHGICGNSRLSPRSLAYTLTFMAAGFATASIFHSTAAVKAHFPAPVDLPSTWQLAFIVLILHGSLYAMVVSLGQAMGIEKELLREFVSFVDGSLFAFGLGISGMTNPANVVSFLDVSQGTWNPTLMFVMGGAILVTAPFMLGFIKNGTLKKPVLSLKFELPTRVNLDTRLILGGVIFGFGWGYAGMCPGPALVNVSNPQAASIIFNAAMFVGFSLGEPIAKTLGL
ncbi:hypothetical protein GUITHDRAFT_107393 [Guillardia theta CCMP2712]|uniref:Sulphur transport domain-containing protein n=2 Tax=Guillardia theta TaxID=55529 RepID=L1JES5_GUITC|nr:hypothetical protein GUITHDRAFT_107393 [Guillardia theta CCMP2712]EKX46610.1 hypothetical protein GUITHDRAFT_107393 [Guillardia theta CCMP2712]|mmetsp:Transcript_31053/g.99627  ORF Transcript_31053/g.99627 Transcript_31053/m.99627 type:complete len:386 (+) Transcript_31053:106-1263(+)|eukprot:XP_005833590.1 hypothetical protein GUITHDRAFT_107393 [Guillardia theta CCMP2712]